MTTEQKQRSEDRKSAFKAMVKQVADMTDEQRSALSARMIGVVSCEGHAYSQFNRCLIASQRENATVLGGFRQWLNQGRCVRKGEHGLAIYVPIFRKGEQQADAESVDVLKAFTHAILFDVSQTEEVES